MLKVKAAVQREKLEQLARDAGCTVEVKASYVKVTKGKSKNCLFVAKTKEVSRVDIGGFSVSQPEFIKDLGGESHGCVKQQIKSDITNEQFLKAYGFLCRGLDAFTPHPKKERQRPHGFRRSKKQGVESVVIVKSEETPEQTIERLVAKRKKLEQVSKEMGIPVSPKTIKEIEEQLEKARKQVNK